MDEPDPPKTPSYERPAPLSVAALPALAIAQIVGSATWASPLGVCGGLLGMPTALWAAYLFGYPGALAGSLWALVADLAVTAVTKPAGQSLAEAFVQPPYLLVHAATFAAAIFAARHVVVNRQLHLELAELKSTERSRHDAERAETQARMNDRLHRADRMASVGTLAAGVAHEINNPLTYVIGNLCYALERVTVANPARSQELREELQDLLRDATDGAERVRRIVRDLKTFSRSGDGADENRIDLQRAVQAATNLVRNEIRHRASLEVEVHELPTIAGNESRLVQVLVNLLMNASQSIPEGNAAAEFIRVRATLSPAGKVLLEVADSGCGMAPEIQARVFDPFFTTKPVGEGTGLGLSVTHGIVASMGGDIAVRSAPGQGTTFSVALPVKPTADPRMTSMAAPTSKTLRLEGRGRRALIVDDEPKVASSVARMLDDYSVIAVTDGRDALEKLEQDQDFDVILCDLMMPHLTGMELFERARAMEPALAPRFVFMTGGAFTPKARAFIADIDNVCIEKPFDASQLRVALRGVLTTGPEKHFPPTGAQLSNTA